MVLIFLKSKDIFLGEMFRLSQVAIYQSVLWPNQKVLTHIY